MRPEVIEMRRIVALAALVVLTAVAAVAAMAPAKALADGQILVYTKDSAVADASDPTVNVETFVNFAAAATRTLVPSDTLPADLSANSCVLLPVNTRVFTGDQKTALASYIQGGGTVIAMAEHSKFVGATLASGVMNNLASALGASISSSSYALDPGYTRTSRISGTSRYTAGVAALGYAYTTVLDFVGGNATVLAATNQQNLPMVAVQDLGSNGGKFVYSADSNIFSDTIGAFGLDDNGRFARNLCGDITPPSVTIVTPPEGARYRLGQQPDVLADWFCTDADSGIATRGFTNGGLSGTVSGLPIETTGVAGDSVQKTFTATCTDKAGNTASAVHHYVVDNRPPTVQVNVPGPGPYALGAVVGASWACTDPDNDVATRAYVNGPTALAGTISGVPIDTAPKGQKTYTVTCTDLVGNSASSPLITYTVPNSPPVASISLPASDARFKAGQGALASWACTDPDGVDDLKRALYTNGGISGSVSGLPLDTTAVAGTTVGKTLDVTCIDSEDATGVASAAYFVDASPPTAAIAVPLDGGVYERGSDVPASWECSDPDGSGDISRNPAKTFGTRAVGQPIDTTGLGSRTFSVMCSDLVGNTGTKTVSYSIIDSSPPAVTITTPKDGATYALGQVVAPSYSCIDPDGIADVRSCVRDDGATGPVPTGKAGTFTFTVLGEDLAGNKASKTVSYTVSAKPAAGAAPTVAGSSGTPAATRVCKSRRQFRIRVKKLKGGVKAVSATVYVNGKRTTVRKGKRITATVTLKGLKKGRYKVVIKVRYSDGRVLSYTRRFKTCTPKGR